ncbi:MAG: hypothetical protein QM760_22775 [Nibricoccus sp.]
MSILERRGTRAIRKLAGLHPLKEIEVLLDAAMAARAVLAGLIGGAAITIGVLGAQVTDIGFALFDAASPANS